MSTPSGPTPRSALVRLILVVVIVAILVLFSDAIATFLLRTFAPGGLAYLGYIEEAIAAALVAAGGYFVVGAILDLARLELTPRYGRGNTQLVLLVLRVVLYGLLVAAVLAALGFNLEGVVVGGAIGGIVLGLALQSLAAAMLAGFLVSGTKTIQPGDHAILQSSVWGSFPGRVVRIGLLFTDALTPFGTVIKLPNAALVGSGTFTKLDGPEGTSGFRYPLPITLSADVPLDQVVPAAVQSLASGSYLAEKGDVFVTSLNGSTVVVTALLRVQSIGELNRAIDEVNRAFGRAYWAAKAAAAAAAPPTR